MLISELNTKINKLQHLKDGVNAFMHTINDPHALIPMQYKNFEDWAKETPFPKFCINHVFPNKRCAEIYQLCSYTYMYDYHVVKCNSVEYYKKSIEE